MSNFQKLHRTSSIFELPPMANSTENSGGGEKLLSPEIFAILQHVNSYLGFVFAVLGVFTNCFNIKTFRSMGLSDGVTIAFFGLSISELCSSYLMIVVSVSTGLYAFELSDGITFTLDPTVVYVFFSNLCNMVYLVTILTTFYLAVAKCVCVAKPLRFKHAFTKAKSIVAIIVFSAFSIGIYLPIFINTGITKTFSPLLNATRYVLWVSPSREEVKDRIYIVSFITIPFVTQVVVIICVIVMTWNLARSAKFRQNSTFQGNSLASGERKTSTLSGRDLQAVQQVVFISVIFVTFNTPAILVGLFSLIEPEFDVDFAQHDYARLYFTAHVSRRVCEQISSAINIFVYYRFNSKFRKHLQLCF